MPRADAAEALISTVLHLPETFFKPKQSHRAMGALVAELEASPRADTESRVRGHPSRHLTPRLSCGARAQPCIRRRPPACRQLQPVVRWPNFLMPLNLYLTLMTGSPSLTASPLLAPDPGVVNRWRRVHECVRSASITRDRKATWPVIDPVQTPLRRSNRRVP